MTELAYVPDGTVLVNRPLWWHERGISQTASGYGRKLTTRYMARFPKETRLRRVYCVSFSNAGTCYVLVNKAMVIVPDWTAKKDA